MKAVKIENNMRIIDYLRDSPDSEAVSDFNGEKRDLWLCSSATTPKVSMPKWFFGSPKQSNVDVSRGERGGGSKLGHWFSRYRRKEKKGEDVKEKEEKQVEEEKGESSTSSISRSGEGTDETVDDSRLHSVEDRKNKEIFFNIGMGIGMTFLLDRWASETNKMTELREQMESFFRDIKHEFRGEDDKSTFTKLNSNSSSSELVQDIDKRKSLSFHNHFHTEGVEFSMKPNNISSSVTSPAVENGPMMNQLEAELQFELDQLQLTLDGEYSSGHSVQDQTTLDSDTANISERFSMNFEPYAEPIIDSNTENFGVSPRELERRLYELLYTRQQEKIAELEFKLELANKRKHTAQWSSFDEGILQLASERGGKPSP